MIKKYGLLGNPLGHSFSKSFFTEKFKNEAIPAEYINLELPKVDLIKSEILNNPSLEGFNVTIPYKEQIIPLLDSLNEEAKNIGAVNVVKIKRDFKSVRLIGYNSDVIGFIESIRPLLKPHHKKALILGTGGASKAIYYGLKKLNILPQYVSRRKKENILDYSDLNESLIKEYSVIINCTPLGMSPKINLAPDIPYEYLGNQHLLFDLIYNPIKTLFLKKGEEKGAVIKNGLEMLHLQALKSWEIWNNDKI